MPEELAPDVEDLVRLLNSWRIPNDTRIAVDELAEWTVGQRWAEHFVLLPRPKVLGDITDARDALREAVSGRSTAVLNRLLTELSPRLTVDTTGALVSAPASADDSAATAVWLVFRLAADGRLPRLRTCPDCGWAFFDSSRNGRRVWCAMTTDRGGRGCGSIAKTRAYRARLAAAAN
jgi:predicted RNA-binding Zn ribbon-like protein